MSKLVELVKLHSLILDICKDKYAIPEMMADRIIKEVDKYITKPKEDNRGDLWNGKY